MKIKKSQLRKMIKESVQEQSTKIAFEQKKQHTMPWCACTTFHI